MPPQPSIVLTTERLVLREFTADDRDAWVAYRSDPRYAEFSRPEESGRAHSLALLEKFHDWAAEDPRCNFQLAIVERDAPGAVIGCAGVRTGGHEHGAADFGIELAPWAWGRGFATEASRALLGFAFRDLDVRTILGTSVTENHRIAHLAGALGFRSLGARPGLGWMRVRGWTETHWRLSVGEWNEAGSSRTRLVNLTPELALDVDSQSRLKAVHGIDAGEHHARLVEAVAQTEAFRRGKRAPPRWGGYLTIDNAKATVVGLCSFKGAPDEAGAVEIAYFIFPGWEGRGYATAAAAGLVDLARASGQVTRVLAHTLPAHGASTRVLAKVGFTHVGPVVDAADGPVWRWELIPELR